MVQLAEQIAAAEAAAARVAELEQVKATADQLPALKRQLAAQQWVAQAEPAAEQAEQQPAARSTDDEKEKEQGIVVGPITPIPAPKPQPIARLGL